MSAKTKIKDQNFSAKLKKLRYDLPYRAGRPVHQKEVAREAGISVTAYQQAESGYVPGEKILFKLALYFKKPPAYFLHEPEPERPINRVEDHGGVYGRTDRIEKDDAVYSVTTYSPRDPPQRKNTALAEAVAGLEEIFDSEDMTLINAILQNIRAFRAALDKSRQAEKQQGRMLEMERRIMQLESDFHKASGG